MRALVAGGAGFLGSGLVDRLLAEGMAVDVLDDLSSGSLANLAEARADRDHQLRIHRHDLRDPATVDLVEHVGPEVVYHVAAGTGDAADRLSVASVGTFHLLEGARRAGATKVVAALDGAGLHAGADGAELPLSSAAEFSVRGFDGLAASSVMATLRAFRDGHQVEYTALVMSTVFGPRQRPGAGPVASIADGAVTGTAVELSGPPERTVDLLYVDDAVDALARAGERGGGLVLNVGTGLETSIERLVVLARECGAAVDVGWSTGAHPPTRLALDPSRARIHLGWAPFTDAASGIGHVLEAARGRQAG